MIIKTESRQLHSLLNNLENQETEDKSFINDLTQFIPESHDCIIQNLKEVSYCSTEEIYNFILHIISNTNNLQHVLQGNLDLVLDDYIRKNEVKDYSDILKQFLCSQKDIDYWNGSALVTRKVDNSRLILECVATPLISSGSIPRRLRRSFPYASLKLV